MAKEGELDGVQVLRAPGEGGAPLVVDAVHVLVEQQAVAPGALVVVPVVGEVQQVHQPQAEEEVQHQLRHGRRQLRQPHVRAVREADVRPDVVRPRPLRHELVGQPRQLQPHRHVQRRGHRLRHVRPLHGLLLLDLVALDDADQRHRGGQVLDSDDGDTVVLPGSPVKQSRLARIGPMDCFGAFEPSSRQLHDASHQVHD